MKDPVYSMPLNDGASRKEPSAQRTSRRFPPVAGSEAFLRMASEQTAENIIQALENGDIRRACNYEGLKDSDFLKVFRSITEDWKLTNTERGALLGVSARTYQRWRSRTPQLTDEQLLRISYLLNLYLDLQDILDTGDETDTAAADSWVKSNNQSFDDRRPIDVMTAGTLIDLYNVYSYVHAVAIL